MSQQSKTHKLSVILQIHSLLFVCTVFGQYDGGSGTESDPFQIATLGQLNAIAANHETHNDKYFTLTADIDMGGTGTGLSGLSMSGSFDGNGNVISNLSINNATKAGFWGELFSNGDDPACIKNLGFINPIIVGNSDAGTICGNVINGKILNCYAVNVSVSTTNGSNTGGLVGAVQNENYGHIIQNCYVSGNVSGDDYVGGLIGKRGNIANCYSVCSVTGNSNTGGLVGDGGDSIGSFWDTDVSGLIASSTGIGKTTLELKSINTYKGWGCDGTWVIDDSVDYPHLFWEGTPGVVISLPVYSGGTGDSNDPFIISSPEDLDTLGQTVCHLDKHFKQTADIDLGGFDGLDGRPAFAVVGKDFFTFAGVFDGNGFTISNFTHSSSKSNEFVGLFGVVKGPSARITGIHLLDPNIEASGRVGSLIGSLQDGYIEGCSVADGTVDGPGSVGGLVGEVSSGNITDCKVEGGNVVGGSSNTGGLVGIHEGTMTNCYSTADVFGQWRVGGLVGSGENARVGTIKSSYASGDVYGSNTYIGGLIGYSGIVDSCYATGNVTSSPGSGAVGGLAGSHTQITFSYAIGTVTGGSSTVGGLMGGTFGFSLASFWDIETTGLNVSFGGQGLTTHEMKRRMNYTNAGWTFACDTENAEWAIVDGETYPQLVALYPYNGGTGSKSDPFQVSNFVELALVCARPDQSFRLANDIDLTGFDWLKAMIGRFPHHPFTGRFDGNGYLITNLSMTDAVTDQTGLFGYVSGAAAEIKNIGLENVRIEAYVSDDIGGLVGYLDEGTIANCFVTGDVLGRDYVGGLIGFNSDGTISNCYTQGNVNGVFFSGGLSGGHWNANLINSYTATFVSGVNYTGGFCGFEQNSTYTGCFWDSELSGLSEGIGSGTDPADVTGLSTNQMQTEDTFLNTGWDFIGEDINGTDEIWRLRICDNVPKYPQLSWELIAGDITCPNGVNLLDFAWLTANWSREDCSVQNEYCQYADSNFDGFVDLTDLVLIYQNWLLEI